MASSSHSRFLLPWLSLGSCIEYYDFVIYGLLVKELGTIFFPPSDPHASVIQAFLIFAVGYSARFLGGALAGILGDKFGRRPVFLWITGCMALSTGAIGLLPSYESVGLLAPVLLTICRFIQGMSFGGEIPGATIILGEFNSRNALGLKFGILLSSTTLGALLATASLALLFRLLSLEQIIADGWRIPFIVGSFFGIVLLLLRWSLPETPIFTSLQQKASTPLTHLKLFLSHFKKGSPLFLGTLFASLIIVNLFFPYYISTYFEYSQNLIYTAITTSLVLSLFITPYIGRYTESKDRHLFFSRVCLIYAFAGSLSFFLLTFQSVLCLFLFLGIHQTFISCLFSTYFIIMFQSFPAKIRYTLVSVSYSGIFALAAFLPSLLSTFLPIVGPSLVPLFLSVAALISWWSTKHLSSSKT